MFLVSDVLNEARRTIHDENASTYRWTDDELIDYLNAGNRQIVGLRPEANTVETVESISNNIARQELPTGGIQFIRAARNYDDAGTAAEGVIRYAEKDALDTFNPDWEFDTTIKADGPNFFEHFLQDDREPKVYYLYPPAAATKNVAVVYSANPVEVSALPDTFALPDEYYNAAVAYIVYRALTKESLESDPAQGAAQWNQFLEALGLEKRANEFVAPTNPDNQPPDAN